jgi:hypothetical protein
MFYIPDFVPVSVVDHKQTRLEKRSYVLLGF